MTFQPKRTSCGPRVYPLPTPPSGLVARAVQLAMMSSTERHSKLVANLLSHGAALRKAQVVRIRRLPTANETSLLTD